MHACESVTINLMMSHRQCEECCFGSEEDLKPVEVGDGEPQSKFGRRIRRWGNNWEQVNIFQV